MKRVIVESPFAGKTQEERDRNLAYARSALRDCLLRGEAPFASHLLYTQPGVLRDDVPDERALGMKAGLTWTGAAELVAVYCDLGITPGMQAGITRAEKNGVAVEKRSIGDHAFVAPEITPASLADLLRSVGIEIDPKELTALVPSREAALAAEKWARHEASLMHLSEEERGRLTLRFIPCPDWLVGLWPDAAKRGEPIPTP